MATAVSNNIHTLKSMLFIIVLPICIGWMVMQKHRKPNFKQPLSTQNRR